MRPKIGIALSGGGARGSIHIGILKRLSNENLKIVALSGTSAGAIVSSAYAFKRLSHLERYVLSFNAAELKNLLDPSFSMGILKGELAEQKLTQLLGRHRIEESEIHLSIVAVDILSKRDIAFRRGPLAKLVHASGAVPGIFEPVPYKKMLLVDGGVLNNLPVDALPKVDIRIAVSLENSQIDKKIGHTILDTKQKISNRVKSLKKNYLGLLRKYETKIFEELRTQPRLKKYFGPEVKKIQDYLSSKGSIPPKNKRVSSVLDSNSFSRLLSESARLYYSTFGMKQSAKPDLLIDAGKDSLSSFNPLAMSKGVEIGERYAEEYLPKIYELIEKFEN